MDHFLSMYDPYLDVSISHYCFVFSQLIYWEIDFPVTQESSLIFLQRVHHLDDFFSD
jgi:hypothetical protein